MNRISPLKDYRELAGMASRSRVAGTSAKPHQPAKGELYERQEDLHHIERSRLTDDRPTPDKHRREDIRDISATRQKERLTDNL